MTLPSILFIFIGHLSATQYKMNDQDITRALFDRLNLRGSTYPSITTRNSVLIRYPEKLIHLNFSTGSIDTLGAGFNDIGFLRNMVDTTFQISATDGFIICERSRTHTGNYFTYTFYAVNGFPDNRMPLLSTDRYLNTSYNHLDNTLLFHPYVNGSIDTLRVKSYPENYDHYITVPSIIEINLKNPHAPELTIFEHKEDADFHFFYSDNGIITGVKSESTDIVLIHFEKNAGVLEHTEKRRYKLNISMKDRFFLKAEQYNNWFILYTMDVAGYIYFVSRLQIDGGKPELVTVYEGESIISRIHNTNLFVIESDAKKKLLIYQNDGIE